MTNQIEKEESLENIIDPNKLKNDILTDRLATLDREIPKPNQSEYITDIYQNNTNKNDSLTRVEDRLTWLTDKIYNPEQIYEQSSTNNWTYKKPEKAIYYEGNWFVWTEEATRIWLIANANRKSSEAKVMDMLPDWLQKLVS